MLTRDNVVKMEKIRYLVLMRNQYFIRSSVQDGMNCFIEFWIYSFSVIAKYNLSSSFQLHSGDNKLQGHCARS